MATKYDALLALMPTGLIGGGALAQLGIDAAIFGGSALSMIVLAYALFVDPPRDPALGPHQ